MSNVQEFATAAAGYKDITPEKFHAKKRGRSVNRREKRNVSIDSRIIREQLSLHFANREFRKEMKQFQKTVEEVAGRGIHDIPMPEHLVALKANAKLAETNYAGARLIKAAMQAYPPLS